MVKTITLVVLGIVLLPIAFRFLRILLKLVFVLFLGRTILKAIGHAGIQKTPDSITLDEELPGQWARPDEVNTRSQSLRRCGFIEVGDFAITEMPGVRVRFLLHSKDSIFGAIYEHPQVGHWIDLVSRYEDGTSSTFTTSRPTGLNPRPGHSGVSAPDATPEQLYLRCRQERPGGVLAPLTPGVMPAIFVHAYAEEMAYRKQHGASAKEVARVVTNQAAA